jgi:2-octaprenyl-6-methoxyphenol hydroxylase
MRVCILGVGLSSLTLAKALVNLNIHVDLISQKKNIKINENRTIGISENNIEYFNNHIINIEEIIWKLKKIEILSENLNDEKLLIFEDNKKYLFSIIKNYKLHQILEKNLLKNKFFKKINKKNFVNLKEDYNLIINTDFNNLVSKKYFSKKIIKKYNSLAYVTVLEHDKITNTVATQIFTKKGPLAFLPISNSETSIVFSINSSNIKREENLKDLINNYNFKYKIKKIRNIETFELKSLSLRSYYDSNILAFGDLLHRIHPLAGQGFNMTLRDIKIIVGIIKKKIDLGLPIDSSINQEFENKTKHKNFIFSNSIDFIYELFNLERKSKNKIISKSIQKIGNYSSINKLFREIANKGI